VASADDAAQAVRAAQGKPMLLRITNASGTRYLTVPAG